MKKYIPLGLFNLMLIYLIYLLIKKEKTKQEAAQKIQASKENIFNPEPYAEGIYLDLNKWFFQPHSAHIYEDILKLSSDELRAVWSYWEVNYKPKAGEYKGYSLGAALESTAFFYNPEHTEIIKKLKALNLN